MDEKQFPSSKAHTVFMLAPQRHGSNKSQSLLAANHPDLYGPYPPIARQKFAAIEQALGQRLLSELTLNANLSPRNVRGDGQRLQLSEVEAERQQRQLPYNTLGIMTAIYHIGARSSGRETARILCKSPDNLDIAERHGDQIEDAVFVHVIRDPRAVWNSGRGTPRGPQTPHNAALQWADYHNRALAIADRHPLITLRYEDLMSDTRGELKRCCEFLNIPFLETMLECHLSQEAKSAAQTNAGLWGNLDKPVLKERAQAWKQELPDNEIAIIDNSCTATMQRFGYEPSTAAELTEEQKAFTLSLTNKAVVEEPRRYQLIHFDHLQQQLNPST
jgi:hypothetical protein